MITQKNGKKIKIHPAYKDSSGETLPSVTMILNNILAKPALIHWAWDLGTKGIDYRKSRDDKADIGTLAHDFIMCHLKGVECDTSLYTKEQIDIAETCFLKYLDWEKWHEIKPVLLETPLISEKYHYGGTPDNYCIMDGICTLVDYKTGKSIYEEYFYQLGGYNNLLIENNQFPERFIVLRIGRDETEGFEVKELTDLKRETEIFIKLAEVYHLIKNKNGGK